MVFFGLVEFSKYINYSAMVTAIPGITIGLSYVLPYLLSKNIIDQDTIKSTFVPVFPSVYYFSLFTGQLVALVILAFVKPRYFIAIFYCDIISIVSSLLLFINNQITMFLSSFLLGIASMITTVLTLIKLNFYILDHNEDSSCEEFSSEDISDQVIHLNSSSLSSLVSSNSSILSYSEFSTNVFLSLFGACKLFGISLAIVLVASPLNTAVNCSNLTLLVVVSILLSLLHWICHICIPFEKIPNSNIAVDISLTKDVLSQSTSGDCQIGDVTRLVVHNLGSVVFSSSEEDELYKGSKNAIVDVERKVRLYKFILSAKALRSNFITAILFMCKECIPLNIFVNDIKKYRLIACVIWIVPFIMISGYHFINKKILVLVGLGGLFLSTTAKHFAANSILVENIIFITHGIFLHVLPYTIVAQIYPKRHFRKGILFGEMVSICFKMLNCAELFYNFSDKKTSLRHSLLILFGILAFYILYKDKISRNHSLI